MNFKRKLKSITFNSLICKYVRIFIYKIQVYPNFCVLENYAELLNPT